MSDFNPYNNCNSGSTPVNPTAVPARSAQAPCPMGQPYYYGSAPGLGNHYNPAQIAAAQLHISRHQMEKAIDVHADAVKQQNLTAELKRRELDRANIAVEKDALGTEVRRSGSALMYSKRRLSKSALDIPIFDNCRSTLFRQAERPENQILGISFDDALNLYLAAEDWNIKRFKKLLTAAGVSIGLYRNGSQNDALQKSLSFLIQEAKCCGVVDVPSTYGWHGSRDKFHRISKAKKDLVWEELKAKCIR